MKKVIVVSAINFFEGGPLTILEECLEYLSLNLSKQYSIIALVHDAKLLKINSIEFIEFPKSRKSWFNRIYYEYFYFYFLSRQLKPHLWLSLHDITPNVSAKIRVVYCHNPTPFYKFSFQTLFFSYQVALFSLFYKYLYRINIQKNNFIVVQQNWLRDAFRKMYGVKNIIVSHPRAHQSSVHENKAEPSINHAFIYPAFPRVFKNFEVVAEAAKLLYIQGYSDTKVFFTLSGTENKYARHLFNKYKDVPTISFIGVKSRDEIYKLYQQVNALIFSSKLETWGLPITEAKQFNIPILLADLPYARETVGCYDKVKFFDPDNHIQLADYMKYLIDGSMDYDCNNVAAVQKPFAENWGELFDILLIAGGP